MSIKRILLDSNVYLRLANSFHPLLNEPFGKGPYALYLIPEFQKEFDKSPRLTNKFGWVNESEYRGWASLDEKDNKTGLYFINFSDNLLLKKVIIGPRNSAKPQDIKELIGTSFRGVEIIKSRLAFNSYRVVENKRYKILTT